MEHPLVKLIEQGHEPGRKTLAHGKWGLGWVPDLPHKEDKFRRLSTPPGGLPPHTDLRKVFEFDLFDQGELGCHDDKTEVLTEKGWTPWSEYQGDTLLGTMNPATGLLEFQAPLALHAYDYDGELYHSGHRSLDFALTPNHRMFVRRWDQKARTLRPDYQFCEARNLGWYAGLPHATAGFLGVQLDKVAVGRRTYSGDDFLALIAAVISCGWVGGTESNWNTISFCCFREHRRPLLAGLAARLHLGEVPGRPGVWKWSDPALAAWFRANAFTGGLYRAKEKRVPDIVKTVSGRQVEHFLSHFGDQHVNADGDRAFYSVSRRMIDDLQELLLRVGKRGSIYERPTRAVTFPDGRTTEAHEGDVDLTLVERRTDRLSVERRKQIGTDHYKGRVYCATVPNSLLVTRRNGSVLVSGNSCTANAIAALLKFRMGVEHAADPAVEVVTPSRLQIYYHERFIEHTVNEDAGAQIRDGIQSLLNWGFCREEHWPYTISQFRHRPPLATYTESAKLRVADHYRVEQDHDQIVAHLAANEPVVVGFTVYQSFESDEVAHTGQVPMPRQGEKVLGGHAVTVWGHDDASQLYLLRNSWGRQWGMGGYFQMPMAYLHDPQLSDDFWAVRLVP